LEAKAQGSVRQLIERLEAQTKTGVTLRVLPGGVGAAGAPEPHPQPERVPQPEPGKREERRELRDVGLQIGSTVERLPLRMHRFATAVRVTDLTNAGKRGKQVDEFALYNLDYSYTEAEAVVLEKAIAGIAKARTYAQALQIAKEAVRDVEKLGGGFKSHTVNVEESRYRGIDVEPPEGATGAKIRIDAPEFELEASPVTFSVRQKAKGLEDTTNHIPPVHGAKKTAIARFYAWAQANQAKIKGWSYRDLMKAMAEADLDYHSFSTYD
jgi:hypothetical protein